MPSPGVTHMAHWLCQSTKTWPHSLNAGGMNFSGMGAGVPRASKYTRWPSHSPLAAAAKSASIEAGAAETGTERARPWTPRERVPIFDREVAPVAPARTRADAVDEPPTNERIDSDSPRVDLGGESELSARIDALFRVKRSPALAAQLNKIYEHHESIPRYTT